MQRKTKLCFVTPLQIVLLKRVKFPFFHNGCLPVREGDAHGTDCMGLSINKDRPITRQELFPGIRMQVHGDSLTRLSQGGGKGPC